MSMVIDSVLVTGVKTLSSMAYVCSVLLHEITILS
jgi:hypothetical protein